MPKYNPQRHNRRSIRLKGYDYSLAGAYFLTICVQNGSDLLGEIADEEMVLKDPGQMVQETWDSILHKFHMIQLDAFVIMPNHVQFIVFLTSTDVGVDLRVHPGKTCRAKLGLRSAPSNIRPPLSKIIQWFKSFTTAKYRHGVRDHDWPPIPGRLWQRNYWERIIRSEREQDAIRGYIWSNPANWEKDRLHPGNPRSRGWIG